MRNYFHAFFIGFFIMFLGVIFSTLLAQIFYVLLDWYNKSTGSRSISILLSLQYSIVPSVIYGFYGVYSEWNRRKQATQRPRRRHPHD